MNAATTPAGRTVLLLAALSGTALITALAAPDGPAATPAATALTAEEISALRPAPREMPPEVKAARVVAQVTDPTAAGGAPLTISLIAPPVLPSAPAPPPRQVPVFTEVQRVAVRAAAPLQNLSFSPAITVYPGGVSLVSWTAPGAGGVPQEYEAWVPHDLTSINLVGDYEVGRTRYSVLGFARAATGIALARVAPAPATLPDGYRLTKGDSANAAALEPLRALAAVYQAEGPQLAATHTALLARQQAMAQWEKANPGPPRPAEIRFWRMDPDSAAPAAAR